LAFLFSGQRLVHFWWSSPRQVLCGHLPAILLQVSLPHFPRSRIANFNGMFGSFKR
jgi:hypothetical protein